MSAHTQLRGSGDDPYDSQHLLILRATSAPKKDTAIYPGAQPTRVITRRDLEEGEEDG